MLDRRLLYVVATAKYGSFTAAAEKVGVTQSAITKSIGDLERQIGYLLFNRTARGVIGPPPRPGNTGDASLPPCSARHAASALRARSGCPSVIRERISITQP